MAPLLFGHQVANHGEQVERAEAGALYPSLPGPGDVGQHQQIAHPVTPRAAGAGQYEYTDQEPSRPQHVAPRAWPTGLAVLTKRERVRSHAGSGDGKVYKG